MIREGSAAPHRPAPLPRTSTAAPHTGTPARPSSGAAGTTPPPRHPTMSNLNKDTEHTNSGGTVEEEVGWEMGRQGTGSGHWSGWGSGTGLGLGRDGGDGAPGGRRAERSAVGEQRLGYQGWSRAVSGTAEEARGRRGNRE